MSSRLAFEPRLLPRQLVLHGYEGMAPGLAVPLLLAFCPGMVRTSGYVSFQLAED